jgi:hypothetical protein
LVSATAAITTVVARLDRAIQYSESSRFITKTLEYSVTRWSLSSGGAMRRPGGG